MGDNIRAKIKEMLGLFDISPEMRAALEIEYAEVMGLEVANLLPTPQEARKKADEEQAELKKQEDQERILVTNIWNLRYEVFILMT